MPQSSAANSCRYSRSVLPSQSRWGGARPRWSTPRASIWIRHPTPRGSKCDRITSAIDPRRPSQVAPTQGATGRQGDLDRGSPKGPSCAKCGGLILRPGSAWLRTAQVAVRCLHCLLGPSEVAGERLPSVPPTGARWRSTATHRSPSPSRATIAAGRGRRARRLREPPTRGRPSPQHDGGMAMLTLLWHTPHGA